ncbi:MAG: phosphoribosylformylglycinamidine cyclo-ligase, partial [Bacteroidetes bacterium]|nr:phosphoribosylformylglycinamidine cyclo-ligase [Bacteroidota bacterium]
MSDNYKSAGVDLKAGEEAVYKIKNLAKTTFNNNVLSDIGHFGGMYELDLSKYKNPVLVSSVDGVGTKLNIAFKMNKHNTIGQDLVNHCVNDIAVCGAVPLYFLDYMAFGKLDPNVAEVIMEGFSIACRENNCALIAGETAEMPGLYKETEYDLSGTIVGIVEKEQVINGKEISEGNILIGFPSTGLHTNGYSLARKVLFSKYSVNDKPEGLTKSLGEELLNIHRSYLSLIALLKNNFSIRGFSHITGGGLVSNTNRILPKRLKLEVDWGAWIVPPIFKIIQNAGNINDEEMKRVFNLGIGLVTVADEFDKAKIFETAKSINEKPILIGKVV